MRNLNLIAGLMIDNWSEFMFQQLIANRLQQNKCNNNDIALVLNELSLVCARSRFYRHLYQFRETIVFAHSIYILSLSISFNAFSLSLFFVLFSFFNAIHVCVHSNHFQLHDLDFWHLVASKWHLLFENNYQFDDRYLSQLKSHESCIAHSFHQRKTKQKHR